jgi:hypothetical protein
VDTRYGVNYAEAQPASTIAGFTLVNQTCGGVLYCGGMALTMVGSKVSSSVGLPGYVGVLAGACMANQTTTWLPGYPAPDCLPRFLHGTGTGYDPATSGQVSIIDSTFTAVPDTTRPSAAFLTDSCTMYLRNVYTRGFANITRFERSGTTLPSADSGIAWSHVTEYVHGDTPPPHYLNKKAYQLHFPVYKDGQRWPDGKSFLRRPITAAALPPADLQDRHTWGPPGSFPSFETAGAINVKDRGVFGDGLTDDTAALQSILDGANGGTVVLPRGIYRLSATLRVPSGVALVGIAHHIVVLAPVDGGFAAARATNTTQPLLLTEPPSSAGRDRDLAVGRGPLHTVVAFVSTISWQSTPEIFAVDWQAVAPTGTANVYRQGSAWIKNGPCSFGVASPSAQCQWYNGRRLNAAMMRVSGDGRFYVLHAEDGGYWKNNSCPDYRHILITGRSAGRRAIYHANWEHAISDANAEVRTLVTPSTFLIQPSSHSPVCVWSGRRCAMQTKWRSTR